MLQARGTTPQTSFHSSSWKGIKYVCIKEGVGWRKPDPFVISRNVRNL
jgi:hypothetical protein